MKINDLAGAVSAVSKYHGDYNTALSSSKAARDQFQMEGRDRTYELLASAYELGTALLDEPIVLADLLGSYGITAAASGQNEFGPIVRALFRKPGSNGSLFNKSAWKFGNVLRYIYDAGWTVEQIPEKLKQLNAVVEGKKYTKLLAAEMADRAKYDEDRERKHTEEMAIQLLMEGDGLGAINNPSFEIDSKDDGCLISLAASWDAKAAQWVIRGVVSTNSDAIKQALKKEAVNSHKNETERLFRELALHNMNVAQLEGNVPASDLKLLATVKSRRVEVALPTTQQKNAKRASSESMAAA